MTFRFRRKRSKDPWLYLNAKDRAEGKRKAAIALERVEFDFEGVHEALTGKRFEVEKTVTVKFWRLE